MLCWGSSLALSLVGLDVLQERVCFEVCLDVMIPAGPFHMGMLLGCLWGVSAQNGGCDSTQTPCMLTVLGHIAVHGPGSRKGEAEPFMLSVEDTRLDQLWCGHPLVSPLPSAL